MPNLVWRQVSFCIWWYRRVLRSAKQFVDKRVERPLSLPNGIPMAIILPLVILESLAMIVKTRVFELRNNGYKNLSELAQTMGISVSQINRVREGKRLINQKFIVGAIRAFPNYKLDDLFYLVPKLPTVDNHRHQHSVTYSTDELDAKQKQRIESTQ